MDASDLTLADREAASIIADKQRIAELEAALAARPTRDVYAAACNALDKAHSLLGFIVRYDGQCTPEFIARCRDWIDGEYDPGTHRAKPCSHNWAKAVLDNSMYCTRCAIPASTACQ